MNPDQVIKEAIDRLAATRSDAFALGAFRMFKEAGATDEQAEGLIKVALKAPSADVLKSLLVLMGAGGALGAGTGTLAAGSGNRGRGAAGGAAGGALGGTAGSIGGMHLGLRMASKVKGSPLAKILAGLALAGTGSVYGGLAGAAGGGAVGGRLARKSKSPSPSTK